MIHAADVEGLCNGIDEELVEKLGEWVTIPTTYAGGGRCNVLYKKKECNLILKFLFYLSYARFRTRR